MLGQRNVKLDVVAIGLLACSALLALALFSYDRADPPAASVYPVPEQTSNACGVVGAYVAHALVSGIGIGAWYVLASMLVGSGLLLVRRPVGQPITRSVGWLMALVALTTLAAMLLPNFESGPLVGPGGVLGAATHSWLEAHLADFGALVLLASVLAAGLMLSTDYLLVEAAVWTVRVPERLATTVLVLQPEEDAAEDEEDEYEYEEYDEEEEDEYEEEEDDAESEVVIRTPTDESAKDSDEDAAEDQEPAPQKSLAGGVGKKLKSALRIKPPKKSQREELIEEINASANEQDDAEYELPSLEMLLEPEPFCFEEHKKDVRRKAKILEKTFANFGFNVRVVEIETGPVIAQYEVELEAGLRLSRITGLADDLAIALRVPSVRIVAPIPGKNTVGIEVPNQERQIVRMREVIEETNGKSSKMRIPIYLGKDVAGNPMTVDLTTLPHLLIAGRTGTGKSVCLNTLIMSILMTRRPDEVRLLMIDPKMVELSGYMKLPHLMHPVVTDMKKAEAILGWAVEKMEERYSLLARAGVRHVSAYNQLGRDEVLQRLAPETDEEAANIPSHLPYIVIVADEMADLMMTAAKEVEAHIIRLAQKSRAVGIHLVLATQKPTVDVITGLIKSNLPARISFQVASRTDSRVVLDEMGADKLLGNGDMLFLWPGTSTLLRGQGAFVSDDEIARVVDFVGTSEQQFVKELVQLPVDNGEGGASGLDTSRDELYEAAVDVVVREGRGSVSLLQRALGIGYGRAARLIDYMAEDGIVGPYNGMQAREVTISPEEWDGMHGEGAKTAPPPVPSPAPKRSNRILPHDDSEEETQAAGPRVAVIDAESEPVESDEDEAGEVYDEADEYADEPEDTADEYEDADDEYEEEYEEDEYEEEEEYEDDPETEEVAEGDSSEDDEWEYEDAEDETDEVWDEDEWEYEEEDEADEEDAPSRSRSA